MGKITKFLLVLFLMLIAFVAGARLGVPAFFGAEAPFNASVATYQLKNLSLDNCKRDLEYERDSQLLIYGSNENNILTIIWPELIYTDRSKAALSHAASYRKANPVDYINQQSLEASPEVYRRKIESNLRVIERVTNDYAE